MQLLFKKCNQENSDAKAKCQIYALIVVPNRELVTQVAQIFQPICEVLEFNLLRLIGGTDKKKNMENKFNGKWCVFYLYFFKQF